MNRLPSAIVWPPSWSEMENKTPASGAAIDDYLDKLEKCGVCDVQFVDTHLHGGQWDTAVSDDFLMMVVAKARARGFGIGLLITAIGNMTPKYYDPKRTFRQAGEVSGALHTNWYEMAEALGMDTVIPEAAYCPGARGSLYRELIEHIRFSCVDLTQMMNECGFQGFDWASVDIEFLKTWKAAQDYYAKVGIRHLFGGCAACGGQENYFRAHRDFGEDIIRAVQDGAGREVPVIFYASGNRWPFETGTEGGSYAYWLAQYGSLDQMVARIKSQEEVGPSFYRAPFNSQYIYDAAHQLAPLFKTEKPYNLVTAGGARQNPYVWLTAYATQDKTFFTRDEAYCTTLAFAQVGAAALATWPGPRGMPGVEELHHWEFLGEATAAFYDHANGLKRIRGSGAVDLSAGPAAIRVQGKTQLAVRGVVYTIVPLPDRVEVRWGSQVRVVRLGETKRLGRILRKFWLSVETFRDVYSERSVVLTLLP